MIAWHLYLWYSLTLLWDTVPLYILVENSARKAKNTMVRLVNMYMSVETWMIKVWLVESFNKLGFIMFVPILLWCLKGNTARVCLVLSENTAWPQRGWTDVWSLYIYLGSEHWCPQLWPVPMEMSGDQGCLLPPGGWKRWHEMSRHLISKGERGHSSASELHCLSGHAFVSIHDPRAENAAAPQDCHPAPMCAVTWPSSRWKIRSQVSKSEQPGAEAASESLGFNREPQPVGWTWLPGASAGATWCSR